MKKIVFCLICSFLALQSGVFAQRMYPPIERDTTFSPYVKFNKKTGNYIIGYMRSAETGKVYETLAIPATKVKPEFSVQVFKENNNFSYQYRLLNTKDGRQDIMAFELEIEEQFHQVKLPSPWFKLDISQDSYTLFMHRSKRDTTWIDSNPIEIKFDEDIGLGDSLTFEVYSSKFPSIITSYVSGRPKYLDFSFVIPPNYEARVLVDSLRDILNQRGVKLKTIGPQKLPDGITNPALLDTLQSYLTFSCDTTWITNQGICRSLEAKLENVERQLNRGNTAAASGSLQAFLNEVKALKGKKISSRGSNNTLWFWRKLI